MRFNIYRNIHYTDDFSIYLKKKLERIFGRIKSYKNYILYNLIFYIKTLPRVKTRGGFRLLLRGVRTGERNELKIFATPLAFFGTPLQVGANLHRGVSKKKPSTYNIGVTYYLYMYSVQRPKIS